MILWNLMYATIFVTLVMILRTRSFARFANRSLTRFITWYLEVHLDQKGRLSKTTVLTSALFAMIVIVMHTALILEIFVFVYRR